MGYIFSRDQKQYRKWRASVDRKAGRRTGLTGQALEQAVMSFAMANPDLVDYVS
jgi:hypothetical protein